MPTLPKRKTTTPDLPKRNLRVQVPVSNFEIREVEDPDTGETFAEFEGHAIRWGEEAEINAFFFSFTERFERGAFKKTIRERGPSGNGQIKFKLRHIDTEPNAAKFIDLRETGDGLFLKGRTIPTRTGRDLAVELREGTLDTFSIGFDAISERIDQEDDPIERTVLEARLWEISAVDWPAYAGATVEAVRNADLMGDGTLELFVEKIEAEAREGKVLNKANMSRLEEARDRLQQVIERAGTSDEDGPEDGEERSEETPHDGGEATTEHGPDETPETPIPPDTDPPDATPENDPDQNAVEAGVADAAGPENPVKAKPEGEQNEAEERDLGLELALRERELKLKGAM